jgi:cytidylate kinase
MEVAMITSMLNLERQTDALARAQKHWSNPQSDESASRNKTAWTIAITREAGAGGTTVAQELGRRLNWPVYDRELVERIAREMGLRSNLLESVDEKQKNWLVECVEAMTAAGPVTESKFVKHLVETLLSLSTLGHCVIVGRGAAQVLPAKSTLRVRLVADRLDRIAAAQRLHKLSEAAAGAWVDQTDRERVRFVKEHFRVDPTDPATYDLVLNTSRWSSAECADFIIEALRKIERR